MQNLAQLKLSIDQASLQVQQAQLTVDNMRIVAPFGGQISVMNLEIGQWVTTGGVAFTLVSPDKQVAFGVPPIDAARLGMGAELTFELFSQTYKVRINQVPSAPVNGLVPLTASIAGANLPNYGSVGTVHYTLPVAKGVLLPITALQSKENQVFVFTIQNSKVVPINITLQGEAGSHVAVNGLNLPAVVIVNAPPGLLAGSTVKIANSPTGAQGVPDKQSGSDIQIDGQPAGAAPAAAPANEGTPKAGRQNGQGGQGNTGRTWGGKS